MIDKAKHTAAVSTLEHLGYTYCGGEQWKPPLGKAPDFGLVNMLHARIAELEAELEAVGAGGVQALSAAPALEQKPAFWVPPERDGVYHGPGDRTITAYRDQMEGWEPVYRAARLAASPTPPALSAATAVPAVPVDSLADAFLKWCAALGLPTDTLPNSTGKAPGGGIFSDLRTRAAWGWETSAHRVVAIQRLLAASPTPPAEQQAPKAAPGAVSDTQHSQFLSDVLTAAGLITHGKKCKALGERLSDMVMRLRTAPQQEAQEPALFVSPKQLAALTDPDDPEGEHGRYLPARKTSKGLFTQPLYTAPQPAPAPLSDLLPVIKGASVTGGYVVVTPAGWGANKAEVLRDAILSVFPVNPAYTPKPDAALAAHGGK